MGDEVIWPEIQDDHGSEHALVVPDDRRESLSETSVLLPRSVSAKINASTKVFMAMCVDILPLSLLQPAKQYFYDLFFGPMMLQYILGL